MSYTGMQKGGTEMKIAKTYRLLLAAALAAGSLLFTRPAAAIDTVYVDDGIVTGKEGAPGTGAGESYFSADQDTAAGTADKAPDAGSAGAASTSGETDRLALQMQADAAAAERARLATEELKAQTANIEAQARLLELQKQRDAELAEKERQNALLKAEQERAANEKQTMSKLDKANKKAEREQRRALKKARFQEIGRDNDYVYYMDMKSARYVQPARSTSERVMDVWVKLVEQPVPDGANPDELNEHYYLEHYYVSPQRKAIQFLSELEVAGRPQNAVRDRAYRVDRWESLIPGSVEETIYHGAVAKMREETKFGGRGSTPSLRDMIEEYLRISL